jgi:hypothetical protein
VQQQQQPDGTAQVQLERQKREDVVEKVEDRLACDVMSMIARHK